MIHAFSQLRPHLDWLTTASAKALASDEAMLSDKGWDKLYARVELVRAAERSIRRFPGRPTHCIFGPRSRCPDDLPFNCDCCARLEAARSKGLVA